VTQRKFAGTSKIACVRETKSSLSLTILSFLLAHFLGGIWAFQLFLHNLLALLLLIELARDFIGGCSLKIWTYSCGTGLFSPPCVFQALMKMKLWDPLGMDSAMMFHAKEGDPRLEKIVELHVQVRPKLRCFYCHAVALNGLFIDIL